jgi:RHS repeat-associated protein
MMRCNPCASALCPAFFNDFTGKERDAETGLDYFGARYYSAAQGRFLSTDPIIMGPHKASNPQNWNLYSYAINNPLKFTDHTGEIIKDSACWADSKCRKWKEELQKTEWGRNIWKKYDEDTNFTLTIKLGNNAGGNQGGETTGYDWDSSGKLKAATIILGKNMDSGYPPSDVYPVTSSLAPDQYGDNISGETLAATKMAHEFGHVVSIGNTPKAQFQMEQINMPIWWDLYRVHDPMSNVIEGMMGATSDQIHRDREWSAESAGAVPFLRDRFPGNHPQRVKQAIETFEKGK